MKRSIAILLALLLVFGGIQSVSAQSVFSPLDGLKYIVEHGSETSEAKLKKLRTAANSAVAANDATAESTAAKGSITVNNLKGAATVKAYRLVEIEKVAGSQYKYMLSDEFGDLFDALGVTNTKEFSDKLDTDKTGVISAAQSVIAEAELDPYKTKTVAEGSSSAALSDMAYGFYLVTVSANTNDGTIYNPMLILVPNIKDDGSEEANVVTNVKSSTPTVAKKIEEGEELLDETTKTVGDVVDYEVSAIVPYYTASVSDADVVFTFEDTMSAGLTYREDAVVKNALDESIEGAISEVTITELDGKTRIVLELDYGKLKTYADQTIKICYSAVLNEAAVIGAAGNENSVVLEYTNDPKTGSTYKKTTPTVTKVYSFGLDITKYELGDRNNKLAGAEFSLKTKDGGHQIYFLPVEGKDDTYKVLVADGAYTVSEQEDGSYTATAAIGGETISVAGLAKTVTTGEGGKLILEGLGEGDYVLTEENAPEGFYAYGSPFDISITAQRTSGELTGLVAVGADGSGNEAEAAGAYYVKWIANTTEYTLPGTGGIGTVIFLGVGVLMVAAACLLLYRRRNCR